MNLLGSNFYPFEAKLNPFELIRNLYPSKCGNHRNLLSHILGKNFVFFSKEVTKELIWRNSFSVTVNFPFFHTLPIWTQFEFSWTILNPNQTYLNPILNSFEPKLNPLDPSFKWFHEKLHDFNDFSAFSQKIKIQSC